ncbi:MAG: hypothetical protein V2A65_00935 [Candidatus Omnitrophota bacterium]
MNKYSKSTIKRILKHYVLKVFRITSEKTWYSCFLEEEVIKKYLQQMALKNNFVVDIGASDGVTMSNTYFLYRNNWRGAAIEFTDEKFTKLSIIYKNSPNVNLLKVKATPDNVRYLLKSCFTPLDFSLLSLDIDSYDYYVLDAILVEYRPSLICVEINEKIPPPIKFTVFYDPNHIWAKDHFYGQSISQLYSLCKKYEYDLVELHYCNAFLIPKEINKNKPLTPEEAYDKGYRYKVDRKKKFPWNSDMESVLEMPPEKTVEFIKEKFGKYEGRYLIKY